MCENTLCFDSPLNSNSCDLGICQCFDSPLNSNSCDLGICQCRGLLLFPTTPQQYIASLQTAHTWITLIGNQVIYFQVRFFNLTLSAGVVSVVCRRRVLPLGFSFWKHLQSCSCGQMVTMGYISDHAEGFFKILIFTPFFG